MDEKNKRLELILWGVFNGLFLIYIIIIFIILYKIVTYTYTHIYVYIEREVTYERFYTYIRG